MLKNIKSFVDNLRFVEFTRVLMLAAVFNFNGLRSGGGDPTPPPTRFDLKEWEPDAFLRLDGQAICVVGSGSASGLEGKVMVPLGVVLCCCCGVSRPGGSGGGDGEGSERRAVDELVVGESVVQLPRIYRVGCGVQRCSDCSAPEDQQVHRSLGFSDQLMSGAKRGTFTKTDWWSIQTTFYKQLLYLYCGTTRG